MFSGTHPEVAFRFSGGLDEVPIATSEDQAMRPARQSTQCYGSSPCKFNPSAMAPNATGFIAGGNSDVNSDQPAVVTQTG